MTILSTDYTDYTDMKFNGKSGGFTLIELLIVVGVLALLLGLLGPAILKSVSAAVNTRQDAEQKMLAGAIIEYWHDNKKWPIGNKDPYRDGEKEKREVNGVEVEVFSGRMVFSGKIDWDPDKEKVMPNSVVFDELYKADFNGAEKTYFDLNTHVTTLVQTSGGPIFGKDPLPAVAQIRDVLDIKSVSHGEVHPIFCYWAKIFKCPKQHDNDREAYYNMDASVCNSEYCRYVKDNGFGYSFKPKDKTKNTKRALFPYRVTIDFYNETAWVSRDY